MRLISPLLGRLRIGRFRDWYRFAWARFLSPGRIVAANLPMVDPPFKLRMAPGSTLIIGRDVRFYSGFHAYIENGGTLEIGDQTFFNTNCFLGVINKMSIGRECMFAPMVTATDGNHRFGESDEPIWAQGYAARDIVIGDNVWLGAKVTVINSIGSNCVIGANAVVTNPIPDNSLAVGIPARVARSIDAITGDEVVQ
jgi:acetyltransferase-like isoleucine patch superfamily enzyme